jgi:hypothetical protein
LGEIAGQPVLPAGEPDRAEKGGRGAGAPNSSLVIERARHSTLACSKISLANSYQEHCPLAAMWWMPYSIPSIRRTIP